MTARLETGYERLSATCAAQVDEACDQFEAAWQAAALDAAARPQIDAACELIESPAREVLLRELIAFEVAARRRSGEAVSSDQYALRFPDVEPAWLAQAVALASASANTQLVGPRAKLPLPGGNRGGAEGLRRLGKFELRRELGRGGFGVVHLAYEPLLEREVALKVPHAHVLADAELRARFQREARAAAGLNHPNIVPVYEAGEADSICYIALAYCPGMTLHDWLRRHVDTIPGPHIAEFVATLADAIHHAHEQGIVHRDLKPANVLLAQSGVVSGGVVSGGVVSGGVVSGNTAGQPLTTHDSLLTFTPKITDFGLAKLLEADDIHTRTGTLAGTPCYMAPEQTGASPWQVGPATDVYALGAILYELLAGRAPFQGETVLDTLAQVRHEEPVPPRKLRPGLPRDLEVICLKCLEKDPSRRYGSAKLLGDDLRRYLNGHSILARPTGPLTQVAKWAVRRPAAAGLVAACALVAALLVASDLYIRQKNREIQTALDAATSARQSLGQSLARERLTTYFQRVRLAQSAIAQSNVRQAERYLDACLPGHGEEDVRGWEWHHLQRLCRQELLNFQGHSGPVWDVAVSADGLRCASLGADGQLLLWNAASGAIERRWSDPGRDKSRNRKLEFSPDGKWLAVGVANHETTQFAVETGKPVHILAGGDPCFSADGTKLATIDGPTGTARIYDPEAGQMLSSLARPLGGSYAHAFRGDTLVVASSGVGSIRIWEGEASAPRELRTLANQLFALEFSNDGRYLATRGFSGHVSVWDVAAQSELTSIDAHQGAVESVAFDPSGQRFASGDLLGAIKLWDFQGRLLRSLPGHGLPIACLRFGAGGQHLYSASSDRTVKAWDLSHQTEATVFRGHASIAYAVAFAPDGKQLASAGDEGGVRIWDAGTAEEMRRLTGLTGPVRHLTYRPDGSLLGCDAGGAVQVWNPATGERVSSLKGTPVTGLALAELSPRGALMAVAGDDRKSVRVRDIATGNELVTLPSDSPFQAIRFNAGENLLVAATADGEVTVYDARGGQRHGSIHAIDAAQLALSRDSRRLATAGSGEFIKLWDVASGRTEHALQNRWGRSNVFALAFSADGRRVASGGFGTAVTLWDVASGEEVIELPTHYMVVTALAFSDDGHKLAAIINDGSIAVWDATPKPMDSSALEHATHDGSVRSSSDSSP